MIKSVWLHFWVCNSIQFIYLPVSVIQFEARDCVSPRNSFIVENSFHYPGGFVIPHDFANCSFYLDEEFSWNFDGGRLECIDCFKSDGFFTMLILLIHKHGKSFHLLRSSSIFSLEA